MPITIPGTNIPVPFINQTPDEQAQADTTLRDQYIQKLAGEHKGLSGKPAQVNTKPTASQKATWTGYDLYTFGDGTTVEVSPDGQIQNLKLQGPQTGTVPSGWTNIKPVRNADGTTTYWGLDPSDSNPQTQFKALPGNLVPGTTSGARQPTPTGQLDRIDAQGNLIPPGSPTPAAKLRDPATGTTIDLPDPAKEPGGTLHEFGNNLLLVKPDGSFTTVASKDPTAPTQAKSIFDGPNGERYEYDPNKAEGQRTTLLIAAPPDKTAPTTKTVNGKAFQWQPPTVAGGQGTWVEAPGLPSETEAVAVYGTGPNDKFRITLDKQGNVVKQEPNENYVGEKPTALTPDMVAPNIPLLQPDGTVKFVPNQNRVPAGQAMQDLLGQVGVKVNGGELNMADAKDMLTGAVNVMNAQTSQQNALTAQVNAQTAQQTAATTAATGVLDFTRQGAATGAGMLQNRVTNANQMLNTVLGLAGQGQRSGNLGGGLMNAPPGLGEQLVGGITGWTTELGGGKDVYDTAARLVQQSDPTGTMMTPEAHTAYGVLGQMLEAYKNQTGLDHPAVLATQAARQSAQNNAFVAPGMTQQQLAQQSAAASMLPRSPFTAPTTGMAAIMPQNYQQQLAQQSAAASQLPASPMMAPAGGMGALPGFQAPSGVTPTIVINT